MRSITRQESAYATCRSRSISCGGDQIGPIDKRGEIFRKTRAPCVSFSCRGWWDTSAAGRPRPTGTSSTYFPQRVGAVLAPQVTGTLLGGLPPPPAYQAERRLCYLGLGGVHPRAIRAPAWEPHSFDMHDTRRDPTRQRLRGAGSDRRR